ncbi:hypothetical protein LPJ61_005790, partial [Coemansia biformis]
ASASRCRCGWSPRCSLPTSARSCRGSTLRSCSGRWRWGCSTLATGRARSPGPRSRSSPCSSWSTRWCCSSGAPSASAAATRGPTTTAGARLCWSWCLSQPSSSTFTFALSIPA